MDYKTIAPGANLDLFVRCFWTLDAPEETTPQKQRIVPDGCMEMIFHHGDLYKQYLDNESSILQPKSFVFGQITRPLDIEPTGKTGIFAVRFNPDGFIPFSTIPLDTMENRAVGLVELFDNDGLQLEREILATQTTNARIRIIETFLDGRVSSAGTIDGVIKSAIATMLTVNGQLSVAGMAKEMKINRRQLERRFSAVIGLSPKQLAKMIRLQATIKLLVNNKSGSLTNIAYEGNYYDQAHFIKDFKEFTGLSPKKFYSGQLQMSSLFQAME